MIPIESCPDQLFTSECRTYALSMGVLLPCLGILVVQGLTFIWAIVDIIRSKERGWFAGAITLFVGMIIALMGLVMLIGGLQALPPSLMRSATSLLFYAVLIVGAGLAGGVLTTALSVLAKGPWWKGAVRSILAFAGILFVLPLGWTLGEELNTPPPQLGYHLPEWMHAGETINVTFQSGQGWQGSAPIVGGPTPGTHNVPITYTSGNWTIRTEASIELATATAHTHLPLRAGNEWVWTRTTRHGARSGTFWSTKGKAYTTEDPGVFGLRVTGMDVTDGVRTFSGTVVTPKAPKDGKRGWDKTTRSVTLLPKNGETLFRFADTDPWQPAVETDSPHEDALSVDDLSCKFPIMGQSSCTCSPKPGGPLAMAPGPLQCTVSDNSSVVSGFMRGLIGVVTLGLVDTGNPYTIKKIHLAKWQQGPPSIASVPPEWTTTQDKFIDCMGGRKMRNYRKDKWIRQTKRCVKEVPEVPIDSAAIALSFIAFDEERIVILKLIEPKLPASNRDKILRQFTFQDGEAEARAILNGEEYVPEPEPDL